MTIAALSTLLVLAAAPAPPADEAPVIEHQPLRTCLRDEAVVLQARIYSQAGKKILEPALLVRFSGLPNFTRVPMSPSAGSPDVFEAQLPAAATRDGFDYYLEAFDQDGNGPARSGSHLAPHRVTAYVAPVVSPPAPPPLQSAAAATAAVPAPAGSPRRTAGIVLAASGAALLVGAAVCAGLTYDANRRAEDASAQGDLAGFETARSAVRTRGLVGDVLGGLGAVAAVTGAVLMLTAPKAGPALSAWGAADGAGLTLSGRF